MDFWKGSGGGFPPTQYTRHTGASTDHTHAIVQTATLVGDSALTAKIGQRAHNLRGGANISPSHVGAVEALVGRFHRVSEEKRNAQKEKTEIQAGGHRTKTETFGGTRIVEYWI